MHVSACITLVTCFITYFHTVDVKADINVHTGMTIAPCTLAQGTCTKKGHIKVLDKRVHPWSLIRLESA